MSAVMLTTRLRVVCNVLSGSRQFLRLSSTKSTDDASTESNLESPELEGAAETSQHSDGARSLQGAANHNNNNTVDSSALSTDSDGSSGKISNYVRAFEKIKKMGSGEQPEPEETSFASLIRSSKLMQIGEPNGRIVVGTVVDVVADDLYIDFGGKFHCVCPRPTHRASDYTHGTRVKLKLKDVEMTSAFLGSDKHVTLLEADGSIIGIHRSNQWTKTEARLDQTAL